MIFPRKIRALPAFLMLAFLAVAGGLTPRLAGQVPDSILDEDPAVLTAPRIPDKIEGVNRFIFKVNDRIYRYALHPLGRGYAAVVPRPLRRGISNFFHNLAYPTRFVGNVLEAHPKGAWKETERFVVNTIIGFGGFDAVADRMPSLAVVETDLGQAFGTWGIGHGTYLVLPLLGPTSLRDGTGELVSGLYLAPVQYLDEWEYRTGATSLNFVNSTPELMDSYENLRSGSIDAYAALRDAFSARRAHQIRAQKEAERKP
jgi:phospholipid-binding lipoprotein MlaA